MMFPRAAIAFAILAAFAVAACSLAFPVDDYSGGPPSDGGADADAADAWD